MTRRRFIGYVTILRMLLSIGFVNIEHVLRLFLYFILNVIPERYFNMLVYYGGAPLCAHV